MVFHHVDPSKKDFQISKIKSTKELKQEHKDELDKCNTLCHNCHSIVHYEIEKPLEERSKQSQKAYKVRRQLIDEKGGKCNNCQITGINDIFSFHHIDDTTKLFNIDNRACNGYSLERLQEEANKCILLCHNCHSEHHHPTCILPSS